MAQTARERGRRAGRALPTKCRSYFQEMCDDLDISYDRFIRTTEPEHHRASQAIWKAMAEKGDLYLDRYEGWYSVRDEAYYDESELIDGEGGEKLSPQGTPVEWTVEESWFFRLSAYQQPLLDHYAAHPDFIQPDSRRNEVLRFVEGGLSRPVDLAHQLRLGREGAGQPGPCHVRLARRADQLPDRGRLSRRRRTVRALLAGRRAPDRQGRRPLPRGLLAGVPDVGRASPLPKQVFGHGFLLARGEKMSKSVGNVVDPIELAERFGVDALRYFLLREVTFGQDGSYSAEAIVTRVNAELANSFGNLAQRSLVDDLTRIWTASFPRPGEALEDRALLDLVDDGLHGAAARRVRAASPSPPGSRRG